MRNARIQRTKIQFESTLSRWYLCDRISDAFSEQVWERYSWVYSISYLGFDLGNGNEYVCICMYISSSRMFRFRSYISRDSGKQILFDKDWNLWILVGKYTNLLRLNEQTLRRENSYAFSRKMDCDVDASVEMKFFFVKGT